MTMEQSEAGFWWPLGDTHARRVVERDVTRDVQAVLDAVAGRQCIVQAGGNVGVYPLALANHFKTVVTAEPDPLNFSCLWRNWREAGRPLGVWLHKAAFGSEPGLCHSLEVSAHNCGANRVTLGGETPVVTIDSRDLTDCDCIWLDVEGFELFALQGAVQTIDRFSPVIICEEKGLGEVYGIHREAIEAFLEPLGYRRTDRVANDTYYKRTA